ncbi:MAG: AAA family ATPase, partial [bacterium]
MANANKKKRIKTDLPGIVGGEEYPLPKAKTYTPLKHDKCSWRINAKKLGFKTTKELKPLKAIVGQPRAQAALKTGTEIHASGYNIYVSGLSATGRSTAVKNILEGLRLKGAPSKDHCYVNNFKVSDQPRLITLPRGKGRIFKQEMAHLVDTLKNTIPHALEDETVLARKRDLAEKYAKKEAELFKKLEEKVTKDSFALVQVQMGPYTRPDIFPIIDGNPVPPNQVGRFVEEGKFKKEALEGLYRKYQGYKADLRAVMKQARQLSRELTLKTSEIEKDILTDLLKDLCAEVSEDFPCDAVGVYMDEIREFIIENPDIFRSDDDEGRPQLPPGLPFPGQMDDQRGSDPFKLLEVNVVRDGAAEDPTPVIIENHPTYHNLFGTVEREFRMGGFWTTDFTQIRGGSLLRADGGFLVLNVMDVLTEPLSWRTLIRTLKTGKLQIQGMDTVLSIAPSSMKPEPIDIEVCIILIGESYIYHLLSQYEEDFSRVFKIRADFDSLMPRGIKEIKHYGELVSKLAANENILHFTAPAVACLGEYGARLTGRGNKISARLGEIADLIRESNHQAKIDSAKLVDCKHVKNAIKDAIYRQDLIRERIEEAINEGILMIDTHGEVIGQINGLAVHDLGTFAFGRPTRITCEVSMGESGVVNIEREAKLSGSIHDKGVLILEGYFRHMYGLDGPITFSASLCFEQSYSQIDGDSATLAEVLALTSELANLPLRQDLAVTGSVNQKGQVQPIGGINEKIEGFFRICKHSGFTGTQGVVFPATNTSELMLNEEVLAAIAAGNFSLYPVSEVDEAAEIFTGITAGKRLKKGGWTKGSVHDRVDLTLASFFWATKTPAEKRDEMKSEAPVKSAPPKRRQKKDDDGGEPTDP